MMKYFLRRALLMIVLLVGINFFAFSYAHYGRFAQLSSNPIFAQTGRADPVFPLYKEYITGILSGSPAEMPNMKGVDVLSAVGNSAKASLGLLGIAFTLSLVIGFIVGTNSARANPPRVSGWLIPFTTMSLAMPGFYIGALIITFSVFYLLHSPGGKGELFFPLSGFGWDRHLILPLIALTFRPAVQIGQSTAVTLSEEFKKQYVPPALSFGHSWRRIRWRTALRNVYAPLSHVSASSLRILVGELILVEWLFGWPGLGRMLASSLQPPPIATISSAALPASYLHPPTVATVVTVLGIILVVADLVFSTFAHSADPRLRENGRDVGDV
jgi:peptide/nickel transport system permease protein